MTRSKAITAGILAGFFAGIVMTVVMLVLALFGVATPLSILGDRISVFFKPEPFLALMGRVGGYNHLKQLGVGSTIAGQLVVGALGGAIYGMIRGPRGFRKAFVTFGIFVLLPLFVAMIALAPVLGTSYRGLPIAWASVVTIGGLLVSFIAFERALVFGFRFFTRPRTVINNQEFTPPIARRALLLGGIGLVIAGGGVAIMRTLYRAATFSYDGTQYKGRIVQPITPNDLFYCVTKNIVDPTVDASLWRLEISGLVKNPRTYRYEELKALPSVEQETTLMCISNGLDAGLMSNALWKGTPLRGLLEAAMPLVSPAKVKLHGVDNYTDTFPLEKAMEDTTLVAYEMNGAFLPYRHGFPARVIVPGYFGEKHVKWLTRIEVADADAKGFYETQGWGPDFIVPTRSRIDVPDHESRFPLNGGRIDVRGVAFGGDRGISRVEISFDDGENWEDAKIDYPGTKLTWALWSYDWQPTDEDDYALVVRATDGEDEVQEWDPDRPFKSGTTGFHKIVVHVTG
jgi:DMSO/TMAO reductase YedYZ molybdopterin-dependent catalytic subunit